ncbi:MAG: hypothetical protein U0930_21400 [Pirellulales bacterium]
MDYHKYTKDKKKASYTSHKRLGHGLAQIGTDLHRFAQIKNEDNLNGSYEQNWPLARAFLLVERTSPANWAE